MNVTELRNLPFDASDEYGMTPLMWAASMMNDDWERVEVVELLLEAGANVNEYDVEGHSPLWHAVSRRCIGPNVAVTIRLLLEAGASVAGEEGKRLLTLAKREGYTDVVEMLEAAGVEEEET